MSRNITVVVTLAVVATVLLLISGLISRNMDWSAATSGSSTRPLEPGSIQDQSRSQPKSEPFTKSNAPPAGR